MADQVRMVPQRHDGPLCGMRLVVRGGGAAAHWAARLLASLGAAVTVGERPGDAEDAEDAEDSEDAEGADGVIDADDGTTATAASAGADWAASGAMALTGRPDGPALTAPGMPASAARGALLAAELLARVGGRDVVLPGAEVLGERAAVAGLTRNAPRSAGGAFRVLPARDGWLGVNLARAADVELLPAWLAEPVPVADPWPALERFVVANSAPALAERARLLGLPVAALPEPGADEQLVARGQDRGISPVVLGGHVHRAVTVPELPADRPRRWALPSPLVVDLSSLWAGPLCGRLLGLAGARVVKVESVNRPDGARLGPAAFYDLLHAGQESVALDFGTADGRAALAALVAVADVVIEGSRPRALRQFGIRVEDMLAAARDKCWVSVTAYGRTGPWANAVGFGDDTALAGGLLAFDPEPGVPAPCGDAIADPLAGVHAAVVALACLLRGGTWLADVALREQAAATAIDAGPEPSDPLVAVDPHVAVAAAGAAPELGADTARVLAELGLS